MILKSSSIKSDSGTQRLIEYLFKKEEKLLSPNNKPIVIRKNIRARLKEKMSKEFKQNEALRIRKRKDSVKAYHTVLSLAAKDKKYVSEKTLRSIAKQYMKLRGNDNLYLSVAHFDHDHIHLHIVSSGTKYLTGIANRISKVEFHQLKQAMDEFQQKRFPELSHSLPEHGRAQSGKPSRASIANIRQSIKERLTATLDSSYKQAASTDSFLSNLRQSGYEPYYRSGRLTGVIAANGLKFRLNRLGYTHEHLQMLDQQQAKESQELSEMRAIRSRASQTRTERVDDERIRQNSPEQDEVRERMETIRNDSEEDEDIESEDEAEDEDDQK